MLHGFDADTCKVGFVFSHQKAMLIEEQTFYSRKSWRAFYGYLNLPRLISSSCCLGIHYLLVGRLGFEPRSAAYKAAALTITPIAPLLPARTVSYHVSGSLVCPVASSHLVWRQLRLWTRYDSSQASGNYSVFVYRFNHMIGILWRPNAGPQARRWRLP